MKKSELTEEVKRLGNHLGMLQRVLADQTVEILRLKRVIQHTQARVSRHAEAQAGEMRGVLAKLKGVVEEVKEGLGSGTWKTAAGHKRFIALLSTGHLKNIIAFDGAPERVKDKCRNELDRRAIDEGYRQEECKLDEQGLIQMISAADSRIDKLEGRHEALMKNTNAILKRAVSTGDLEEKDQELRRHALNCSEGVESRVKSNLKQIVNGLGGMQWKSRSGHSRFLVVLSDLHLNNLLQHKDCQGEVHRLVREELQRREIDRQYPMETQASVARGMQQAQEGKLSDGPTFPDRAKVRVKRSYPSKRKAARRSKKA